MMVALKPARLRRLAVVPETTFVNLFTAADEPYLRMVPPSPAIRAVLVLKP
jgi:hypothetical protein